MKGGEVKAGETFHGFSIRISDQMKYETQLQEKLKSSPG